MKTKEIKKKANIRHKRRGKPVKFIFMGIVVVLAVILLAIFLQGRVKETDKGIVYKRFGVSTKEKWVTKKDSTYYFGKDGYACTGWNDIEDETYFFDKKGVMQKGWLEDNNNKYFLDMENGKLVKGFCKIKEDNYYFDEEDGSLKTGIILKDDKIIAYSGEDGKLVSGAYEIDGTLRCFSETGESKEGWVKIGDDSLYCNSEGMAAVGNTDIEGKKYFFDEKGILQKGWCEDSSGNKYYGDEQGILLTGKQTIEGKLYYFDENAVLKSGWINISDSERSYAGQDGVLFTGKQVISGIEFTFDENGVLVEQNSGELKMVALTFDDGPSVNTDKILDVLENFGCKATFYVVGSRVSQYSSQLKRAADLGCEVGSHTFNHKYFTSLSAEDMQSELDRTDEAVSKIIGHGTTSLRPPGGFYNDEIKSRVKVPIVMWSVDTQDWKSRNAQSVIQIATTGIQDGDIILMHDLYSSTAEAVATIVPTLISQGFQIVTVQELLDAHGGAFGGKVYFTATEVR